MTFPSEAQGQDVVPRRWRSLDDEQRQVAAELVRRAEVLREGSEDGLSIRGALDIAARQIGRRPAPQRAVPVQPDVAVQPESVKATKSVGEQPSVPAAENEPPPAPRYGPGGTHCQHDHELTPENVYRPPDGSRRCITCKRAHALGRLDNPAVREAARTYNRERQRAIAAGTWVFVRDRTQGSAPTNP